MLQKIKIFEIGLPNSFLIKCKKDKFGIIWSAIKIQSVLVDKFAVTD
jgi:hypothetical protein